MAYGVDFSDVGENEFSLVNEKPVNAQQLQKISKAILRMGLAMGITEGLESNGVMAEQCSSDEIQVNKFHGCLHAWFSSFVWWLLQLSGGDSKGF